MGEVSISTPILVSIQWRHLVCFLRFDENLKVSVSQLFLPTTDAPRKSIQCTNMKFLNKVASTSGQEIQMLFRKVTMFLEGYSYRRTFPFTKPYNFAKWLDRGARRLCLWPSPSLSYFFSVLLMPPPTTVLGKFNSRNLLTICPV